MEETHDAQGTEAPESQELDTGENQVELLQGITLQDFRKLKDIREKPDNFLRALARASGLSAEGDHEQLAKRLWAKRKTKNNKGKTPSHVNGGTLCRRCQNIMRVTYTGPEYRRYVCDSCGNTAKIPRR